jgi:hypothetical protein
MQRSSFLILITALAVLQGACGSDSDVGSAASPSPSVPPTGPVSVRALTGADQPAAGIDVVFGDASGAVLQHTQTDASGQASLTMDAGGMVTLITRHPDNPNVPLLQTITDLRPGDTVETYASIYTSNSVPLLGKVQIDFPGRLPSGTFVIMIDLGCQSRYVYPTYGDRLQGYVADVYKYCPLPADGTLDVFVTALNGDFVPLAFSTSKGIILDPSRKTPAPFPDGWRTDFRKFGLEYANVPAGLGRFSAAVMPVHEGTSRGIYGAPDKDVVAGESGARTMRYPDLAEGLVSVAELVPSARDHDGPYLIYERMFADLPDSARVDFATDVPPLVTNVALTDGTSVRPGATWKAPADLSNVDLGTYTIEWRVGDYYASWSVTFPPDAQSPLRVPVLPAALAALRPPPDPGALTLTGVGLEADSTVAGYHEYLAAPTSPTAGSWAFSLAPPSAGTGRTAAAAQLGDSRAARRSRGAESGVGLKRLWVRRAAPSTLP